LLPANRIERTRRCVASGSWARATGTKKSARSVEAMNGVRTGSREF
jgi:hypothetical protein